MSKKDIACEANGEVKIIPIEARSITELPRFTKFSDESQVDFMWERLDCKELYDYMGGYYEGDREYLYDFIQKRKTLTDGYYIVFLKAKNGYYLCYQEKVIGLCFYSFGLLRDKDEELILSVLTIAASLKITVIEHNIHDLCIKVEMAKKVLRYMGIYGVPKELKEHPMYESLNYLNKTDWNQY